MTKIGFIGQGFIGKNYSDDLERRGYEVIRYALEVPYVNNKEKIKECNIVFIAVPTPSTPEGFDDSILKEAIELIGDGSTVVIKSTILPGTTDDLQKKFPNLYILHSPEFLSEVTAAHDAANPFRNIIGIPIDNEEYRQKAQEVLETLPESKFDLICKSTEAELVKYAGNNWFYFKVIFVNMLYDLSQYLNCDWNIIRDSMAADPRIGTSHLNPVHKSGTKGGDAGSALPFGELHLEPIHKTGRGAGGHCFIKDFAAFQELYTKLIGDELGVRLLEAMRDKNIDLLKKSHKDLDLLKGVYGESVLEDFGKKENTIDNVEKKNEPARKMEAGSAIA